MRGVAYWLEEIVDESVRFNRRDQRRSPNNQNLQQSRIQVRRIGQARVCSAGKDERRS